VPTALCRRQRAGLFGSAAARRQSQKSAEKIFFQRYRKSSFYPQNSLMTFFSHRKLQQNKYTATVSSATHRQIIGGNGALINKSWQRPQIVGGGVVGAQL